MTGGQRDYASEPGLAAEEAALSFAAAVRSVGDQMVAAGWIKPPPPRRHGWYPHKPARRRTTSHPRPVGD